MAKAATYKCALGDVPIFTDRQVEMMGEAAKEAPNQEGYGLIPRDYDVTPEGSFCAPFDMTPFDKATWAERLESQTRNKARLSDLLAHFKWKIKNQGQTPLCWAFAAVGAVECAILQRHRKLISLSPASVGQLIQGPNGMQGGWSSEAIKKIAEAGIAPSSLWPDNKYGRAYDNEETKAARKAYMLTEWLDLKRRNFDQVATCLLMGFPVAVGYNHWSHAIYAVDLVKQGSDWGVLIANSWGTGWSENGYGVLMGSKAVPDDATCPNVTLMQVA